MDDAAKQQAFVNALVTEHFVLQSERSSTIGESNGRASLYLTSLSSSLVALGFAAQVGRRFDAFVVAILPALFVLGEFTFVRLVQNSIEDVLYLQRMQRIRGWYRELVPEGVVFFADTMAPVDAAPAARSGTGTPEVLRGTLAATGMRASRWQVLFTTASMIAAVNSILCGAGIALAAVRVGAATGAGTAIGVLATLAVFAVHFTYQGRAFTRLGEQLRRQADAVAAVTAARASAPRDGRA